MLLSLLSFFSNRALAENGNSYWEDEFRRLLIKYEGPDVDQYKIDTLSVNMALEQALRLDPSTSGVVSAFSDAVNSYKRHCRTYYGSLYGILKTREGKLVLEAADKAWEAFCEADYAFFQVEESERYVGGGTLSIVLMAERELYYYKQRLEVLNRFSLRTCSYDLKRSVNKAADVASIEKRHAAEDAELNRIYQWVMKDQLKTQSDKNLFRAAQRAWLKYREAELKFSQLMADDYSDGMGAQTIDADEFRLEVLSLRVDEYRRLERSLSGK